MMKKVLGVVIPIVALSGVLILIFLAAQGTPIPVLDTKGVIGNAQRDTLYLAVSVMLVIVLPVFGLLLFIAIRYRETNKQARYTPNWASNKKLEAVWWGVPILIVTVLSVITWNTSHSLDPYRPISSDKKPLQVQVVALQWKWLFLYPEHNVASVGELALPVDRPVEFTITSDAPMNSFWIPQLGGQVYAMAGMSTKLHLNATEVGSYRGVSANLSGEGHASMNFEARALTERDFSNWVQDTERSTEILSFETYEKMRLPSLNNAVTGYVLAEGGLYDSIIKRYGHAGVTESKQTLMTEEYR